MTWLTKGPATKLAVDLQLYIWTPGICWHSEPSMIHGRRTKEKECHLSGHPGWLDWLACYLDSLATMQSVLGAINDTQIDCSFTHDLQCSGPGSNISCELQICATRIMCLHLGHSWHCQRHTSCHAASPGL